MANRYFTQFMYSLHKMPTMIDCNFVVDSTNANGLGISSLKGPGVQSVFMQSLAANPASGPNGAAAAPFGGARTYGIIASSTVTNTGSSVVTGSLALYPGTAITGFPPGVVTGATELASVAAANAMAAAQATYTALQALTPTTQPTALDALNLGPGVYKAASGTFTLNGTLTLTGTSSDVFIFQTTTTLVTGASGTPVITLAGGAVAANVYWVVGSSATLNSANAGTHVGNVIAQASVTDTLGTVVNGSLVGLTGAVTLSAAAAVNTQALPPPPAATAAGNPNPGPGLIVVRLKDNYSRLFAMWSSVIAPTSGTAVKVDNSALTAGQAYVITTVGNTTLAQWIVLGVPVGVTPAIGVVFIAQSVGAGANTSTSRVMTTVASGIATSELLGNPNVSIAPINNPQPVYGASFVIATRTFSGAISAPVDGSILSYNFYLGNSSVTVQGE